jgi:hypothetical protein
MRKSEKNNDFESYEKAKITDMLFVIIKGFTTILVARKGKKAGA